MRSKTQFYPLYPIYQMSQSSPTIPIARVRMETPQQRFARLKQTADATGRRLIHVYLEDERKRKGEQH
ncbi:hypothetical protein KDA_49510 [Dictyobacter alpinus]|uniref:Uncharacterized protein n=1 Tax=Dictyobacter alpinus TaxID=2014873 RepID=A0A402BDY4_9CHLR|nr:hypothetical protein KDA_49510 [Dictyobacter alpinus]